MEKLIIFTLILAFFVQSALVAALKIRLKRVEKPDEAVKMTDPENKTTKSILEGIENNEFKMYLQFVVDNKTKKVVSAEALSRWDNPQNGIVGPGNYIGHMERTGLISKHDFYMFERACQQLEKWSDTEFKDISISCNFTRITLSEEGCIDKLKMILQAYKFDKSKLAIEITEDAIEKDMETAKRNVRLCRDLGFKIDRDILLKAITKRGKDLFSGIIALAHNLNITVICEGVETEEQNTLVSQSDCDYIQGWYYTKALPIEECEAFMEMHSLKYS